MGKSDPGALGGSGRSGASAKKRRLPWKVRLFLVWPIYGLVLVALGIGASLIHYTIVFPNPLELRVKERAPVIRILARDGSLLAERGRAHDFMPLDLMPPHVSNAVIATEDRRFYSHWGIDPLGLARASFTNLRAGRYVQGGSTLTQQLAKNLFLSSKRTLARKFEELLLAIWLEVRLSKADILELYLNRVYFGGGAYGIEAAAQLYFDKSARALSISEAAMIAGLLKAPSRYSPRTNPGLARARTRTVLRRMHDAGFLTGHEYARVTKRSLRFARRKRNRKNADLDYAIDYALERLPVIAGMDKGEIIVETTIDKRLQRYAQRSAVEILHKEGRKARATQAAVVILDLKGGIRALVGGRSHARSQYNRATKAKRQPGSAFKPFVYLTALEQGLKPSTISYDLPIDIKGWKPRNYGGWYRGAVSLRTALTHSINTVAVRLCSELGTRKVIRTARRLGITSKLRNEPSLALGTSEVSLLELTGAYGVLANGGFRQKPHIIRRIRMSTGRILYAWAGHGNKRIVNAANIGAMNDMLNAAIVVGTGKHAAIERHPAAGKTGTTQKYRDAWFVGYTARYVAGVWIGNDNSRPMKNVTGGGMPARLWHKLMTQVHKGLQPLALPGTKLLPPKLPPKRRWKARPETGETDALGRMLLASGNKPPQADVAAMRPAAPASLHLPKARIGEDFIARALEPDEGPAAPVAISAWMARPPVGSAARDARGSSSRQPTLAQQWFKSGSDALMEALGMAPEKAAARRERRPAGYMSLGGARE